MDNVEKSLNDLVALSNNLGIKENDFVIMGEGNTSARADGETFFVKASGTQLETIKNDQFVRLYFDGVLKLLDTAAITGTELDEIYNSAKFDKNQTLKPSVETLFHAVCLSYNDINFVGHTHPTAINILTCSKSFPENLSGRMYPDEIVVLGRESIFVPYIDPGVTLAKIIKEKIDNYIDDFNEPPKVIYMQNHGLIALGVTAKEVENITKTAVKSAMVRYGAIAAGGIELLSKDIIEHIAKRPDEIYRKKLFKQQG